MNEKAALANARQFAAGRVEVAPRAIATITALAVTHCYGVVGMAPRNLRESVTQVLRPEDQYKGIEVQTSAEGVEIDLYVVVEYGTRIATVARNIMETVQYAVEQTLGMTIITVNVHIQGIRVEPSTRTTTLGRRLRRFGGGLRGQRNDESVD